jgi:hypothetical protein
LQKPVTLGDYRAYLTVVVSISPMSKIGLPD